VHHVVGAGAIIADDPEDPRGHSCVLLGYGRGPRPLPVGCAPTAES
jgi:hypothetical protein